MSKEKHLAKIDKTLLSVLEKTSNNLGDKTKIAYTKELENDGKFKKIAFDVYQVENDPYVSLWTLEDVDGKPYLVRASDPKYDNYTDGNWTATNNYDKDMIILSYKNVPVAAFDSKQYTFSKEEVMPFKLALLDNVKSDESFIKDILLEQSDSKRIALFNSFPELKKYIKG
jgi:hypothetical protein